jgi:hypothetical protein
VRTSKLLGALAAVSFLVFTATARADVAPPPSGGHSSIGGASSATGGATSAAVGGTTSTATSATTGGTSSSGSSATGNAKPNDDSGCSIGTLHRSSGVAFGFLGVALALGLRQARRRK